METKEQEIFLKNMPRAIDSRIVAERPHLARAIAAEHLIQVFMYVIKHQYLLLSLVTFNKEAAR